MGLGTTISVAGSIAQFVNFTIKLTSIVAQLSQALTPSTRQRLFRTHGLVFGAALYVFLNPAYEQLERMEDQILRQKDEDIEKYRNGYLNECNMAAVAVSFQNPHRKNVPNILVMWLNIDLY
jgi:hypothetical protein